MDGHRSNCQENQLGMVWKNGTHQDEDMVMGREWETTAPSGLLGRRSRACQGLLLLHTPAPSYTPPTESSCLKTINKSL